MVCVIYRHHHHGQDGHGARSEGCSLYEDARVLRATRARTHFARQDASQGDRDRYDADMSGLVLTDVAGACATVTLNRPEAHNALSADLIAALDRAIEALAGDAASGEIRAVVLAGAGKSFCAGMDLKSAMADPRGMRQALRGLSRVLLRIRGLPVPTISRVQEAAIGGGCGLMVVCDFTVTHPEARVGYPEVSLGLSPAVVAPWLMRRIGGGRARAMLLSGRTVTGAEALEMGLASHLAPRDRLEAETARLAAALAEGSSPALATTKRWLNDLDGSVDDGRYDRGADLSADILAGAEAQQRLAARFGGGSDPS